MNTQEYIKCVGCWLYMSCWVEIHNRGDWWSTMVLSRNKEAPFQMNDYLSRNCFDQIFSSLQHNDQASEHEDEFHIMRQWEEAWNKNMEGEYSPSWVSVLYESMMEWINKYCPDYMCVGRKPHPSGNKRHTISCALTSTLLRALIV